MQSSKNLPLRKGKESFDLIPWFFFMAGILMLSVFGANLRSLFQSVGLWPHLLWVSLFGLILMPRIFSGLGLALFLVVFLVENNVERLHFIIFGLFGFFSARLFTPPFAASFCLLMGAGDELLQYFLPSRVGDLRDVGFNLIAATFGLLFLNRLEQ